MSMSPPTPPTAQPPQTPPPATGDGERLARLALSQVGEPGDLRIAAFTAQLGAERLLELLRSERDVGGVLADVRGRLQVAEPQRDLEVAERRGIRWVVPGDAEWPTSLDQLDAAEPLHRMGRTPLGLWVRGPLRLDRLPRPVAIVGSRSATTYGTEVATELGAQLARAGSTVISGAAVGIDQAAHRGALAARGPTVAVLACGVDRPYPVVHRDLLAIIAEEGAIVSELAPGCAPMRSRFLSRNRIIAGLALGSVVVEAAIRSGALNTSTWTSRLFRPVMGVPGPVTSATSQGVHELIRTGSATLVSRAEHVLELVGRMGEHLTDTPREQVRARDRLTQSEQQVLDAVPVAQAAVSEKVARTAGRSITEVHATLTVLAARGLVERMPTGWRLAEDALSQEVADVPTLGW